MFRKRNLISLALVFGEILYALSCLSNQNFKLLQNKKSPSQPFLKTTASSRISCSVKCNLKNECKAAQYRKPQCELVNIKITNSTELADAEGWTYLYEGNECDSSPCANGGSCIDGMNSYTCECPAGYAGVHCSDDIDECASSPCVNGGSCVDGINSFSCECFYGYDGVLCSDDIDECASSPCANGGSCVDGINSFSCGCPDGYTGVLCSDDIDECASSPCVNDGSCVDGINSFSCECPDGYAGVICSVICNSPLLVDIPDTSFSASSYYVHGGTYHPKYSPISTSAAWAAPGSTGDWIKVDLGQPRDIAYFDTQGSDGYRGYSQWVTEYKLEFSLDGLNWFSELIFNGNSDMSTIVRNQLPGSQRAQYVRLTVLRINNWPTLQWQLYGCPL